MSEKELEQKIGLYRILESRLEAMSKQRDLLFQKLAEIRATAESVEDVEKNKGEIIFPLGSQVYSFGKMSENKNFLV